MKQLKKNTSAMNLAGALCALAAVLYLFFRNLFKTMADLALNAAVSGASLQNPAGISQTAATFLRMGISALALAAPFLLLRVLALPKGQLAVKRASKLLWSKLFLLFWCFVVAGNLLAGFLGRLEQDLAPRVQLPAGAGQLILVWLAVCLLPAVGEELLFRGLLQGWLVPYGPLTAIVGQAVLFALLHGRASACVSALFGGLAFGLCAYYSQSVYPGMVFHLYNNTLAFSGQYTQQFSGNFSLVYYALLFGGPLVAILSWLSARAKGEQTKLAAIPRQGFWLAKCPGWLTGVVLLAGVCAAQTLMNP